MNTVRMLNAGFVGLSLALLVAMPASAQSNRIKADSSPTAGISSTPMQTMESTQIKRTGRQDAVLAGGGIPSLPSIVLPGGVAKPELCTDPAATNNGGALPCVYAPVVPPDPPRPYVEAHWVCASGGEVGNSCKWRSWSSAPLCDFYEDEMHPYPNYGGRNAWPGTGGRIVDPIAAICSDKPTEWQP